MASINKPRPKTRTHEGGKAQLRSPKQEMFMLAAAFLNEPMFYETSGEARQRVNELAVRVCADLDYCQHLVEWLRGDGGLRTSAQVVAVALVHARLSKGLTGGNRRLIASACKRADEGPAVLAAWQSQWGRNIPKPVRRGVADALSHLNEASWLKWRGKTNKATWSLADTISYVHPVPVSPRQSQLFNLAVNGEGPTDLLTVVNAREQYNSLSRDEKIDSLSNMGADRMITDAALTHENVFSSLGQLTQEQASAIWTSLLPHMGYQATLMNLRRISEACGENSPAMRLALEKTADPAKAGYHPMPIAFLSAWRNTPDVAHPVLEKAARYSLVNVPELDGHSLIMVDRSGSMNMPVSARSQVTNFDVACMFAAALGLKNKQTMVIPFEGEAYEPVTLEGCDPLAMRSRFGDPYGGTCVGSSTQQAWQKYGPFDRVLIITDEQTNWFDDVTPDQAVPQDVPLYVWNVAGYRGGVNLGSRNRLNLGGLTDAAFTVLRYADADKDVFPWS